VHISNVAGKASVGVNGKAAALGARLMNTAADQIIKEFYANLLKNVQTEPAPQIEAAMPVTNTAAPPSRSLNGFAFFWTVLKSFFAGLLSGKKGLVVNIQPTNFGSADLSAAHTDPRVSVVVLAAGLSARMGDSPKLLLDVGGAPMIRRTVQNVLDFAPAETVVVTGHLAEKIEAALNGLPVRHVRNPEYRQGQPTSVAAGVRALSAPCDAIIIMLGDQPLVTADHLRRLSSAYAQLDRESIVVPYHKDKRGNPILIAARHISTVISGGLNIGCRRLVETQSADVCRAQFDSDVYVVDCDTPDDYRRLLNRWEQAR
jgi:molybdenum cofactor cytidylyltransferase